MEKIFFDFTKTSGKIKPINCVNNGPTRPGVRKSPTNFCSYKAAEFPYARNHDASFYTPYGGAGEHIVDVHRIFKNFDADENDPSSYIFEPTDEYLLNILNAGTKIFYRLGASIEHGYKYGTRVPPDFNKWARICEHIIRHCNEGWANGFELGIEYWEIWNEPECRNADGSNPCWQGTEEEFIDMFEVAAKHLKKCFPDIKIGGPAFCSSWPTDFKRTFLKAVKEREIPLDFYSYHWYGCKIKDFEDTINVAQEELELAGLGGTETILNEWNYVRGWSGEIWQYSLDVESNHKGMAFLAGALCSAQEKPLDMLMYYDARPCAMNGLFKNDRTFAVKKPYYTFLDFSELYKMGNYVKAEGAVSDIYTCAARDEDKAGIMITYYNDNDDGYHADFPVAEDKKAITLCVKNPFGEKKVRVEYRLTDMYHENETVKSEFASGDSFELALDMPLYSMYYISMEQTE